MFFSTFFAILAASTAALAVPVSPDVTSGLKLTGCPISNAKLSLPSNQTALTVPGGTPVYIALGVGVQNYTCGSTGTFTSAGAVAKLFDISCLVNTPLFPGIQDMVFAIAGNSKGQALVSKLETILKPCPVTLGDHYFIPNPAVNGTGLTPVFDFRAGVKKGDPAGFVAVKKLGNTPSPAGSSNVDWLMLQNIGGAIGGSLANTVMRVDTKAGQPPASCTPNATISVPYTTKYSVSKYLPEFSETDYTFSSPALINLPLSISMDSTYSEAALYAALALSGASFVLLGRNILGSNRLRHPPSPKSYPLIGNLLSIPSGLEHEAYMNLGQELKSDIIYIEVFGQRIIVLNSAEDSFELLERRSAIYSDRFCPTFAKDPDLFDLTKNPGICGYNDLWRHHRRMMNKWLNVRAVTQFDKLLEHQTHRLLHRLLKTSTQSGAFEGVEHEFLFAMASTILRLGYGYRLESEDDAFFTDAQLTFDRIVESMMFTNFYVNIFPALTYIPEWFPGTGWKRTGREWRRHRQETLRALYEWTKRQVKAGTAEPSVLKHLLEDDELIAGLTPEEKDERLQEQSSSLYGGEDLDNMQVLDFNCFPPKG